MTGPTPASCPSCLAPLSPDARFCHRCGRAVTAGGVNERRAWIVASLALTFFLGLIIYYVLHRPAAGTRPDMANVGSPANPGSPAVAPPDISQLTPRERFLRLHDRVMSAAEAGDTATVVQFSPMAIAAYGMVPDPDVDLRFHVGAIHIRLGDYQSALALADSIAVEEPASLMADMLRLEVAQARNDSVAVSRYTQAFLKHFPLEIEKSRPEYREHRELLEKLKQQLGP